jgi:hypothetical protein
MNTLIYHVNSYHSSGLDNLSKYIETTKLSCTECQVIIQRMRAMLLQTQPISYAKMEKIQRCLWVLFKKYPEIRVCKFMVNAHQKRVNRAVNLIRLWVVNRLEDPNHPIGRARKLKEYEWYIGEHNRLVLI